MKRRVILIAHNLRSCHNVGSLFRTAEGLGVHKIYLTGYTPYPLKSDDDRMPHLANKTQKQIDKTALGAVANIAWKQTEDISSVIQALKKQDYTVCALEQTPLSLSLTTWVAPAKIALIVGRETAGLEPDIVQSCDLAVEIPMLGQKESFNVVQAAAMALYHCTFYET